MFYKLTCVYFNRNSKFWFHLLITFIFNLTNIFNGLYLLIKFFSCDLVRSLRLLNKYILHIFIKDKNNVIFFNYCVFNSMCLSMHRCGKNIKKPVSNKIKIVFFPFHFSFHITKIIHNIIHKEKLRISST